jgi:hypothetical protein
MQKSGTLALILIGVLIFTAVIQVSAQGSTASVEIALSATQIAAGQTLTADVLIRDGSRIAGADVRVEVDGICLQIESLTPGDYLPVTAEDGGFSPVSTYDNTSARLAANIIRRDQVASGSGVYMQVGLRALCDSGTSTVQVSRAELVDDTGQQFTAAAAPQQLTISGTALTSAAQSGSTTGSATDSVRTIGLGLILTILAGVLGFVGWLVIRSVNAARR